MDETKQFYGYIKFVGPSVDEGRINVGKIGKSLIALNKTFKKYIQEVQKFDDEQKVEIKLGGIQKGCTEIQIFFEQVMPIVKPVAGAASALFVAKAVGLDELGKQFFGTIGKQLALKIFSKGKRMKEGKASAINQKLMINLININGEEKKIPLEDWETYKKLYPYTSDLVQIEKGEKMKIGYKDNNKNTDVVAVEGEDREFFDHIDTEDVYERMKEPFDDEKAEECRIVGKFVDYYGLAHKYHFSFQARKNQQDIGKKKILCIIDNDKISEIIDYLKPEKSKNICIFGKTTRDFEGKIDKIKIEWVSEDENYNPDQSVIT